MRKCQRLKSERKRMIRVWGDGKGTDPRTGFNGVMDAKKCKAFISPFSKMKMVST